MKNARARFVRIVVLSALLACGRTDLGGRCASTPLAEPLGLTLSGGTVDDGYVYWITGGGVAGPTSDLVRTPKNGGATMTLAANVAGSFDVDATHVFYSRAEANEAVSIWSAMLDGHDESMLAKVTGSTFVSSTQAEVVLASSQGITAVSKSGGALRVLSPRHATSPVRSDGQHLYFGESRVEVLTMRAENEGRTASPSARS